MSNPSCHNYPRGNLNISAHPAHSQLIANLTLNPHWKKSMLRFAFSFAGWWWNFRAKHSPPRPHLDWKRWEIPHPVLQSVLYIRKYQPSSVPNNRACIITYFPLCTAKSKMSHITRVEITTVAAPLTSKAPSLKSKSYYKIWTSWLILQFRVTPFSVQKDTLLGPAMLYTSSRTYTLRNLVLVV